MKTKLDLIQSEYDDMNLYVQDSFTVGSVAYYTMKEEPGILFKGRITYADRYMADSDMGEPEEPDNIEVDVTGEFVMKDACYFVAIKADEKLNEKDYEINVTHYC